MQIGFAVIALLAVLTGVEYVIAVEVEENLIPIVFIAQVKAALIIWYFMHVARIYMRQRH
jgi:hypothetical protein